ncbi:VOC family protein [Epilithonimonas hungarica]|uniref:Glyoxalase/Bleomycin resistance protein/Dioxygenase superfamily protein n=1 Tax=Epilithonimonas hungarica TaxID=454006 RepID=A0A1G7SCQ2_9FLAO|nr:VOC family protein [Epilithonimonas hungarica]SDG20219.1 Glyoxalase/Bleomycin resistance protein/Dioxygenase superfamily protein [Epilithonimonas hungarica]
MSSNKIIKPKLHHVNFNTNKLQEMIDWYALVLGMKANFQSSAAAFLSNDESNHRIAMINTPQLDDDPNRYQHISFQHHAYEYDSLNDLLDTYFRLKEHGIVPLFNLDHGLTTSMYYVDPDRHMVELQIDNHEDWAASTIFLQTSEDFRANPIGVEFVPEEMKADLDSGLSLKEIHKKSYAGAYKPETPFDFSHLTTAL